MKRKFINENGLILGKISIIDILVVVLVIMLGLMVYARFFTAEENKVSSGNDFVNVPIEVKISGVRIMTYDALRVGDKIYSDDDAYLGTLREKSKDDYYQLMSKNDGSVVNCVTEGRYVVTLIIDSPCLVLEDRHYASGTLELNENADISIRTKYLTSSGKIYGIG